MAEREFTNFRYSVKLIRGTGELNIVECNFQKSGLNSYKLTDLLYSNHTLELSFQHKYNISTYQINIYLTLVVTLNLLRCRHSALRFSCIVYTRHTLISTKFTQFSMLNLPMHNALQKADSFHNILLNHYKFTGLTLKIEIRLSTGLFLALLVLKYLCLAS